MKTFKKQIAMFIALLSLICVLSVPVFANSPPRAVRLSVDLSALPKGAVYADLLIKIDESDEYYVDFQPNEFVANAESAKEIIDYSASGYRSYTFHYKDAKSNIKLYNYHDDCYRVEFCGASDYREFLTQYETLIRDYREIKIALLDKNFKIIKVSEETKLPKKSNLIDFNGYIDYDVSENTLKANTRINPYFVVFGGFFSGLIIFLSIITELLAALLFRFKKDYLLQIIIINLCTQIIMRILYIALPFTYLIETIILEVLVYSAEFLIYKKRFKETSTTKIAVYTVVANTLSLVFGIILDCYILA